MFAALIGLILLALSLSIEPVIAMLKVKKISDKMKSNTSKTNIASKFKGGTRFFDKFRRDKVDKKTTLKEQMKKKALDATILSLKAFASMVRSCGSVLISVGGLTSILAIIPVIMIVATLGSVVVFAQTNGGNVIIGGISDGGNSDDIDTPQSDGSILSSIETVAYCYINEGSIYSQSTYKGLSCLSTTTDNKGTARLDCTGFCQAVVRYHMGEKDVSAGSSTIYLGNSGAMLGADTEWTKDLEENGWTRIEVYDGMPVSELQPGDMLAGNGHYEFWLGDKKSFGWGSKKENFPSNNNYDLTLVSGGGFKYAWNGGSHTYTVIYRYIGTN